MKILKEIIQFTDLKYKSFKFKSVCFVDKEKVLQASRNKIQITYKSGVKMDWDFSKTTLQSRRQGENAFDIMEKLLSS